jgi:hypothetical protein
MVRKEVWEMYLRELCGMTTYVALPYQRDSTSYSRSKDNGCIRIGCQTDRQQSVVAVRESGARGIIDNTFECVLSCRVGRVPNLETPHEMGEWKHALQACQAQQRLCGPSL